MVTKSSLKTRKGPEKEIKVNIQSLGSAVNPVFVKETLIVEHLKLLKKTLKAHPHSMGAWSVIQKQK
jgi:monomeric isocitrate dehydrogenase